MQINLSQRLMTVADFVPKGACLLDVGSDHAYLPIYLMEQGLIDFAIAGEVVKGPYDSAVSNVSGAGLSQKIAVRLANGLSAFEVSDEVSTISICGMGGRLIADILSAGLEKLTNIQRLVLQPNNREDELRYWIVQHGFKIVAEKMVSENGKFYEIIVIEHGFTTLSANELRFGPLLNLERSAIFKGKWQVELQKLEGALSRIPENHADDRSAIFQKIQAIKEVINEG